MPSFAAQTPKPNSIELIRPKRHPKNHHRFTVEWMSGRWCVRDLTVGRPPGSPARRSRAGRGPLVRCSEPIGCPLSAAVRQLGPPARCRVPAMGPRRTPKAPMEGPTAARPARRPSGRGGEKGGEVGRRRHRDQPPGATPPKATGEDCAAQGNPRRIQGFCARANRERERSELQKTSEVIAVFLCGCLFFFSFFFHLIHSD